MWPTRVKIVAFERLRFLGYILVAQLSQFAFSTTCHLCVLVQFREMANISPVSQWKMLAG